jgi:ABC-type multidrug transport system fused ATPase/permease subunit
MRGMKIVKFNAWEFVFEKIINTMRKAEETVLFKLIATTGIAESIVNSYPLLSSLMTLWVYNSTNTERLSIESSFLLIGLFNVGVHPLRGFIRSILDISAARIAFERINKLLGAQESPEFPDSPEIAFGSIEVDNGSFSCDSPEVRDYFTNIRASPNVKAEQNEILEIPSILKGIDLTFEANKFTVIIGEIGSGKSCL